MIMSYLIAPTPIPKEQLAKSSRLPTVQDIELTNGPFLFKERGTRPKTGPV